jgi:hypothetical protein
LERAEILLVDTQVPGGFGLGEAPLVQNLIDCKREADFSLALFGFSDP